MSRDDLTTPNQHPATPDEAQLPMEGDDRWDAGIPSDDVMFDALAAAQRVAASASTTRPIAGLPEGVAERLNAAILARAPMRRGHLRSVPEGGSVSAPSERLVPTTIPAQEIQPEQPTVARRSRIGRAVAAAAAIAVTIALYSAVVMLPNDTTTPTAPDQVAHQDSAAADTDAGSRGEVPGEDVASNESTGDTPDVAANAGEEDSADGDTVIDVPEVPYVTPPSVAIDEVMVPMNDDGMVDAIPVREIYQAERLGGALRTIGGDFSAASVPTAMPSDTLTPVMDDLTVPRSRVLGGNVPDTFAF